MRPTIELRNVKIAWRTSAGATCANSTNCNNYPGGQCWLANIIVVDAPCAVCNTPPAPYAQCTPPATFATERVVTGNQTWAGLVGGSASAITTTIKLTGTGILTVSGDLDLTGSGAVLYVDGPELRVVGGNFKIEASGARAIFVNARLRTTGNTEQKPGSFLCITGSEVEIGDEIAGGLFSGGSTSANYQNDGGKSYFDNVVLNITSNLQLSSSSTGEAIFIDVCGEIGDRGANNAMTTAFGVTDGDDSGNLQNGRVMQFYNSRFALANGSGVQNEGSGTMTFCESAVKVNNGNFQNSGIINGCGMCLGIEDQIQNNGTWTASISSWYAGGTTSGTLPINPPAESTAAAILSCFPACEPLCNPPVITCPGNTTVACGASTAPAATGTATATNGCGTVIITSSDAGTPSACGYTITRTWTATDANNNTSSCNQFITVSPAAPASFATPLPGNISIACGAAPPTGTPLSYSNGATGACLISGSVTSQITGSFTACAGGTFTETWTFGDACDRTISHSRTITVQPAPAASFVSLPGDITISCSQAPPAPSSLNYSNGQMGACLISGSVTSQITGSFTACAGGTFTETWAFGDACDRTISHSRTITVQPAPAASFIGPLPGDITVSCSVGETLPTSSLSYSNGQTGACTISGSVTSSITRNLQACPAVFVETWTFADLCGRAITHSRNIIVSVLWDNGNISASANGNGVYSCSGPSAGLFGPFQVTSAGYGGHFADIKHFVYTQLSGDGQIIAQFVSATNAGFGGIMIRETLNPGSKKVNVRTQSSMNNVQREVRATTNGMEVTQQWTRTHKWLRLDRTGNVFNAYTSPTGKPQ
ncbi:MAG: hypothetical protein KF852_10120 [Saprospiraceae bacterium]|nr:hypothetical protein [Saprospiraceae bacterium]